jgi:hypothetical protein
MKKTSRKTRLNPSKLLVLLLYGTYPYLDVEAVDGGSKRLTMTIGKFANLMRVRKDHIMEYLAWLEEMNFITIIKKSKDKTTLILDTPTLFKYPEENIEC